MGVEFNLEVIEQDVDGINVKLFELADGDVTLLFNELSSGLIVVPPSRSRASVITPVKTGLVETFSVAFVDMSDGLSASDFEVGQRFSPIQAQAVPGHNFSAIQLVVGDYRGQQMAQAKSDYNDTQSSIFGSIEKYQQRLTEINTITKAAVQPSNQPEVLIFN